MIIRFEIDGMLCYQEAEAFNEALTNFYEIYDEQIQTYIDDRMLISMEYNLLNQKVHSKYSVINCKIRGFVDVENNDYESVEAAVEDIYDSGCMEHYAGMILRYRVLAK